MRIHTQKIGAGRERDYHAIKRWLYENDVTIKMVADDAGIDRTVVSHTIWGMINNRKALAALVGRGCPAEILSLPDDMKGVSA
ncbi:DNA-binding protein [Deltaproteobacteria bacterium Smac51]|nr:DNA-binding protein [Deltaproteobacteria bacterium Smac51]